MLNISDCYLLVDREITLSDKCASTKICLEFFSEAKAPKLMYFLTPKLGNTAASFIQNP